MSDPIEHQNRRRLADLLLTDYTIWPDELEDYWFCSSLGLNPASINQWIDTLSDTEVARYLQELTDAT